MGKVGNTAHSYMCAPKGVDLIFLFSDPRYTRAASLTLTRAALHACRTRSRRCCPALCHDPAIILPSQCPVQCPVQCPPRYACLASLAPYTPPGYICPLSDTPPGYIPLDIRRLIRYDMMGGRYARRVATASRFSVNDPLFPQCFFSRKLVVSQ